MNRFIFVCCIFVCIRPTPIVYGSQSTQQISSVGNSNALNFKAAFQSQAANTNVGANNATEDSSRYGFWRITFPPEHYIDVLSLIVGFGTLVVTAAIFFAGINVLVFQVKLRRLRREVDATRSGLADVATELQSRMESKLVELTGKAEEKLKQADKLSSELERRLEETQKSLKRIEADHLAEFDRVTKEAQSRLGEIVAGVDKRTNELVSRFHADLERWNTALHGSIKVTKTKARLLAMLEEEVCPPENRMAHASRVAALIGEIIEHPDSTALEIYYSSLQKFPDCEEIARRVCQGLEKYIKKFGHFPTGVHIKPTTDSNSSRKD